MTEKKKEKVLAICVYLAAHPQEGPLKACATEGMSTKEFFRARKDDELCATRINEAYGELGFLIEKAQIDHMILGGAASANARVHWLTRHYGKEDSPYVEPPKALPPPRIPSGDELRLELIARMATYAAIGKAPKDETGRAIPDDVGIERLDRVDTEILITEQAARRTRRPSAEHSDAEELG